MESSQTTLAKEAALTGIGLHSGEPAEVRLIPAKSGHGITLTRTDAKGDAFGPLTPHMACAAPLCTLLKSAHDVTVSTAEHLLATLHALGIDALHIEVSGPEIPILDGSALPWVNLIDQAGRTSLTKPRNWLRVVEPVSVLENGRVLMAEPDPRAALRIACTVEFPHPAVGRQHWQGVIDEATFRTQIAPARTFVLEKDIAAARAAGLAKGGSLENAVVFGEDGTVKTPGGLRFPDEPVRHKVLDVVGDMYLTGRPVWGKLSLTAPGHTANNALLRRITG